MSLCKKTIRARSRIGFAVALAALFISTLPVFAVVVRGTVRSPLNQPMDVARVQLVKGGRVLASTLSLPDGSYELRTTETGQFVVLATHAAFAIYISEPFYGGELDLVTKQVNLSLTPVREQVTVTATGLPTPMEQVSAAVYLVPDAELATQQDILQSLRLQPGVNVVQTGRNGGLTSLFVRGASSTSNKVLIDGVPANDVGGTFDFGPVSTQGVSDLEVHRGPDSVLYGSDALGSVLRFDTPRGSSTRPVLDYTGSAGNFHTWQNAVTGSGAYHKLDYLAGFARYDTSNGTPWDQFHVATSDANVGYAINGSTSLRGTVRNAVSATGLPGQIDFYGIANPGKQLDQDIYFTGVLDNTFRGNWHNQAQYYGSRKREQGIEQFFPVGTQMLVFGFPEFFGAPVTIQGANGFAVTGPAAFNVAPDEEDFLVSNRDGLHFQSDYRFTPHLSGLLGFRYEDERGGAIIPFEDPSSVERRNYEYNLQFQGDIKGRVFYTLGGAIQKNHLFGTEGEPRFGIAYFPVRPGTGWFHGTKLHANFSKGVQEPSLFAEIQSLSTLIGPTQSASAGVGPIQAERSRTYEGGIDQNIYRNKVVLRFNYFHNEFGNQIENVSASNISNLFGISLPPTAFGAYLNSLSFKAQGIEASGEWQITDHLFLRGGYTYTDAIVQHSFSSDVEAQVNGFPTINPAFPNIPIGGISPLIGQRPFRLPPQTGYMTLSYSRGKWSGGVNAAFVSRADDSTFLEFDSVAGDESSLYLPNRNLDFRYQRVDANVTWQARKWLGAFVQMNNVLGEQHMSPIGFASLPFNFMSGLKLRLGGY